MKKWLTDWRRPVTISRLKLLVCLGGALLIVALSAATSPLAKKSISVSAGSGSPAPHSAINQPSVGASKPAEPAGLPTFSANNSAVNESQAVNPQPTSTAATPPPASGASSYTPPTPSPINYPVVSPPLPCRPLPMAQPDMACPLNCPGASPIACDTCPPPREAACMLPD